MVHAAVILAALLASPTLAVPFKAASAYVPTKVTRVPREFTASAYIPASRIRKIPTREFTDVEMREPGLGKLIKGAAKVAGSLFGREEDELNSLAARELEGDVTLRAREPVFGHILKGAAKIAGDLKILHREMGDEVLDTFERELADHMQLNARDPSAKSVFKKIISTILPREIDYDDLD